MQVRVTNRCAGHGRCYSYAPDVFEDDDLGYGVVKLAGDVPEHLREAALTAVTACPENAIEVED